LGKIGKVTFNFFRNTVGIFSLFGKKSNQQGQASAQKPTAQKLRSKPNPNQIATPQSRMSRIQRL